MAAENAINILTMKRYNVIFISSFKAQSQGHRKMKFNLIKRRLKFPGSVTFRASPMLVRELQAFFYFKKGEMLWLA